MVLCRISYYFILFNIYFIIRRWLKFKLIVSFIVWKCVSNIDLYNSFFANWFTYKRNFSWIKFLFPENIPQEQTKFKTELHEMKIVFLFFYSLCLQHLFSIFIFHILFSLFEGSMDKRIHFLFYVQWIVEFTDDPKNNFKSCIIRKFNLGFLYDTHERWIWWKIYGNYLQRILQCPTCFIEG